MELEERRRVKITYQNSRPALPVGFQGVPLEVHDSDKKEGKDVEDLCHFVMF